MACAQAGKGRQRRCLARQESRCCRLQPSTPSSPQHLPLHPLCKPQPGSSGAYIDSERFTRDPLQLSVGDRTAAGDARALPEAKPRVAPALAAVVAAGQAAALLGLPWDLGMNNIEVSWV